MTRLSPGPRRPAERIDWREGIILVAIAAHLLVLPWSIGGMPLWSQQFSLALGGLGFVTGLFLRLTDPALSFRDLAVRILRHPPLWLGGAVIAYIAIQAFNPAWKYIEIGDRFYMLPIEHIEWLPAGAETPLRQMSPFRHLLIMGAALLAILNIGLFLHTRRALRVVFILLSLSGLALAAVGFGHVFFGAEKVLWTYEPIHDRFYGTFIYRNHAAAYLNIVFAISAGLYFFYRERSWNFVRSGADVSPLYFFTALGIFTLALFSQSRAGTALAVAILLFTFLFSFLNGARQSRLREATLLTGLYTSLFAIFIATFIGILGWERITERFARLAEPEMDSSVQTRLTGYQAGWDMYRDNWLWGWGAGNYEYMFPAYQEQYPEIASGDGTRRIWQYAHNDPLQYLIEYGAAGMSFVVLLGGYWAWQFARRRVWRRPLLLFVVIGGLAPLAHSVVDFPLHNPAVLITAGSCFALAVRYLQLEREARENHQVRIQKEAEGLSPAEPADETPGAH